MAVYVAEIAGRGIAAMNASADEAEEWFCGEQFKADLSCFDDKDGNPLWDGEQEIYVREALPEDKPRVRSRPGEGKLMTMMSRGSIF
jgi:hypothetical protein